MTDRWSYAIAVPAHMADELWDELYPDEIVIEHGSAEMTHLSLYPTPRPYAQAPKISELIFFCLMSPGYGETATVLLPNEDKLIVYRNGKLAGVTPNPHPGTYDVYILNGFSPKSEYLSEDEANAVIAKIFEDLK